MRGGKVVNSFGPRVRCPFFEDGKHKLRSMARCHLLWNSSKTNDMMISKECQRIRIALLERSLGHNTSNSERSSTPLYGGCYSSSTERLPGWREFAEGIPIFPEPCCYYKSMSSEESGLEKHFSIPLEVLHLLLTNQLCVLSSPSTLPQEVSSRCHHLMSAISSRNVSTQRLADVADLTTIPQKFPPTMKFAQKRNICGREIVGDLVRNQKTHDKEARFKCFYPRAYCHHKSGYFNRKYDFKRHLLHRHFILHDSNAKRLRNLTDKLEYEGTCPCGKRMKAREWLIHIVARDLNGMLECEDLKKKTGEDIDVITVESRI
jgi:hypothetical protein